MGAKWCISLLLHVTVLLWCFHVKSKGFVNNITAQRQKSSEEVCVRGWMNIAQSPLQLGLTVYTRKHLQQASGHDFVLVITEWVCSHLPPTKEEVELYIMWGNIGGRERQTGVMTEEREVYSFYLSADMSLATWVPVTWHWGQHCTYGDPYVRAIIINTDYNFQAKVNCL